MFYNFSVFFRSISLCKVTLILESKTTSSGCLPTLCPGLDSTIICGLSLEMVPFLLYFLAGVASGTCSVTSVTTYFEYDSVSTYRCIIEPITKFIILQVKRPRRCLGYEYFISYTFLHTFMSSTSIFFIRIRNDEDFS